MNTTKTEEDTFKKLRKPSFSEMLGLIDTDHPTWWADLFHTTDKDVDYAAYLKSYHWTLIEWWDAWLENRGGR